MRTPVLLAFCLAASASLAQTAPTPQPELPKDPRALLELAHERYDFLNDPQLKPWHLKATYQLYDDKGNAGEQGVFEFWWASPKVYRVSWTRPSASLSEWHAEDGTIRRSSSGAALLPADLRLRKALLSPIPGSIDPQKIKLTRIESTLGATKYPCVALSPIMNGEAGPVYAVGPTYCFSPDAPALVFATGPDGALTGYRQIAKVQQKFLAREIHASYAKLPTLSATVDEIGGIAPTDAALVPATDAKLFETPKMEVPARIAAGMLIKKVEPIYPVGAKATGKSGMVVVRATIGKDGNILNPVAVVSNDYSFSVAAVEAVKHWKYKPYLLNGEPVEVLTMIYVYFGR